MSEQPIREDLLEDATAMGQRVSLCVRGSRIVYFMGLREGRASAFCYAVAKPMSGRFGASPF